MSPSRFRIDWVLTDQLALGPAPRREEHLQRLEREGIRVERFLWARQVLPDHHSGRLPTLEEMEGALEQLARLRREAGAVYVHCVASMERSPLVCLAWLQRERGLSPIEALDDLMQVHPGTNPLPAQLGLLA